MNIERIQKMEKSLEECVRVITELNGKLEQAEQLRETMGELFDYYGSEAWYEDREGELPEGVKAGVLSEDLVYDAVTDTRDAAFRMLELGTDLLKNRM